MDIRFFFSFTFHPPTRLLVSTPVGQGWDEVFLFLSVWFSWRPSFLPVPIHIQTLTTHTSSCFLSSADACIVHQEVRLGLSLKSLLRLCLVKERAVHVALTVIPEALCNVFHQTCQKRSGRTVKSEVRCILEQREFVDFLSFPTDWGFCGFCFIMNLNNWHTAYDYMGFVLWYDLRSSISVLVKCISSLFCANPHMEMPGCKSLLLWSTITHQMMSALARDHMIVAWLIGSAVSSLCPKCIYICTWSCPPVTGTLRTDDGSYLTRRTEPGSSTHSGLPLLSKYHLFISHYKVGTQKRHARTLICVGSPLPGGSWCLLFSGKKKEGEGWLCQLLWSMPQPHIPSFNVSCDFYKN